MPSENVPLVPKENPTNWGSIKDVVNAPLIDITPDAWWISALGFWLFLPLNLLAGILGGLCQGLYVCYVIGTCCIPGSSRCCSVLGSVLAGRPLYMAWTWWRSIVGGLVALAANGGRLGLFLWQWAAMGSGTYFWGGAGIWTVPYDDCDSILRSEQDRQSAFACITACVPDLFASNLLIFLPNHSSSSEWWAIRHAIHEMFLDMGSHAYKTRVHGLSALVATDWKDPKLADLSDVALVDKMVSKCIFYVMFGEWVTDADAEELSHWHSYAAYFVLPRLAHRIMFNFGINKVKQLRENTAGLVEKYGQQDVFVKMNNSLPEKYRRSTVVKLCDEIMYVIGFAGIGGTASACLSVGAFLQAKLPTESPGAKYINFGEYDTSEKMVAKYKAGPDTYIMETCRLVPPVTSATSALKEDTTVTMAGREFQLPKGMLNQYVVSLANRDPSVFPDSNAFDPDRPNLTKALTWNGAFGSSTEDLYPRICPGRHLSLDIAKIIIGHALGHPAILRALQPGQGFGKAGCW